jgi:hypothetical protein
VEYTAAKPSALSGILVQTVCGAASRVPTDAMAFRHRAFPYAPVIVSQWLDAADTGRNVSWARDCWEALHPFAAGGVYVNDLGENDDDRVPVAYGANYQRLAELKKKYDPDNPLDAEPDVDRRRRELVAGERGQVLSRTGWALFEVLYAARGSPVSTGFLVEATAASGLREHIRRLRRALVGSRYRIDTYRGIGYLRRRRRGLSWRHRVSTG